MMTERIFKSMMNRLPVGEYDATDLWSLYTMICPKSYRDISKYENDMRYYAFCDMFREKKYGFGYMFNYKIEYLGTNDLHSLMVRA